MKLGKDDADLEKRFREIAVRRNGGIGRDSLRKALTESVSDYAQKYEARDATGKFVKKS